MILGVGIVRDIKLMKLYSTHKQYLRMILKHFRFDKQAKQVILVLDHILVMMFGWRADIYITLVKDIVKLLNGYYDYVIQTMLEI